MPASLHPLSITPGLSRRTLVAGMLASPITAHARSARLLHADDFRRGLGQWQVECEQPGRVTAHNGMLEIDVPAGATLWFRQLLHAPVAIDYSVTPVAAGGPNDRVSDINCFWMATDPAAPAGDALARPRSGAFADYDTLQTYYAGLGGNANTTSRFRRYVGRAGDRPLLPRHDLHRPADLLQPNRTVHLRLVANGRHIALLRDGVPMFVLDDPAPYRTGHFALRTVQSHLRVQDLRIWRLGDKA